MRFITQWGCNSSLLDMPLPHTLNPTSLGGGEHTHDQPPPHLPLLLSDSLSLDFPWYSFLSRVFSLPPPRLPPHSTALPSTPALWFTCLECCPYTKKLWVPSPAQVSWGGNQSIFLSLINVFLSLCLSLPHSINQQTCSLVRIKEKQLFPQPQSSHGPRCSHIFLISTL